MSAGHVKFTAILLNLPFSGFLQRTFELSQGEGESKDEGAQITSVAAVYMDSSTAYITWSWKEPPEWMESGEWITEVKIEHSSVTYPENNIPLYRQDLQQGE